MPTLNSRSFGMPAGYNEYGDALPSYGNGMSNYSYMPAGGSGGGGMNPSSGGGSGFMGGLMDFALPGLGGLLSLFGMKNANKQKELDRQQQQSMQTQQIQANEGANTQALVSKESLVDPFRSRMAQVGDVSKLDRVANATYSKPSLNVGGPFAGFKPTVSGGYSYQKSPELVNAAKAAQTSVLSGTPDPTMTNPSNYGKTGALDLLSVAAGKKDPSQASSMATGAPASASTLGSDPVANVIREAFQRYAGKNPTDAEILAETGNGSFTINDPRLMMSVNNIRQRAQQQPSQDWAPSYGN